MRKSKAVTLIELLIAVSIFLVVMLGIYSAFSSGIFGYRNIGATINGYQNARLILERINLDLRNSFSYSVDEAKFSGRKNELSFLTLVDTFKGDVMVREYAFVSYKVEGDKLFRLCRKNQQALNVNSEISPEEIGSGLSVEFTYISKAVGSKGVQSQDNWLVFGGSQEYKNLPCAVKVILTLKEKNDKTFQRIIYL